MFKDPPYAETRFYCTCLTRTYTNGVCDTCGGVENPRDKLREQKQAAWDTVTKTPARGSPGRAGHRSK